MPKLNADDYRIIEGRIRAAEQDRELRDSGQNDPSCPSGIDRPEKWLSLVAGTYWDQFASTDPTATRIRRSVNRITPKLRAKHDVLTGGDTALLIEPRAERFRGAEEAIAAMIQDDWDRLGIDQDIESARWDSDTLSYGVVEVGWAFERGDETLVGERGSPKVPESAQPLALAEAGMVAPTSEEREYETEEAAERAAQESRIEEDRLIWGEPEVDDPFVERFNPRHLIVDPNCRRWDLSDARHVWRVRWEHVDRLKANKRYKNTAELKGSVYITPTGTKTVTEPSDLLVRDDAALVKVYDGYTWLLNGGKEQFLHLVMTDEHDLPLLEEPCPYISDTGKPLFGKNPFPYRVIPGLIVNNDDWQPDSVVEHASDLQLAFDESWDQLNEHRRKSNRQYLMAKGRLDAEAVAKLENGIDNAVIEVEGDPKDVLYSPEAASVQPEVYSTLEMIDAEMSRVIGVSDFAEAVIPDKKMLATEINALATQGSARTNGDAKRYRRFREDVATCLLLLYQKFADRARVFHNETADGREHWGVLDARDLRGVRENGEWEPEGIQYRVKIDVSDEGAKSKEYDRELKLKMLQVLGQFANQPDPDMPNRPLVNIKALIRIACKAFDIKNLSDILPPPPSPEEQAAYQAQQLQQADEERDKTALSSERAKAMVMIEQLTGQPAGNPTTPPMAGGMQ